MRTFIVGLCVLGGLIGNGCASRVIVREETCRPLEVRETTIQGYLDCEKE